MLQAKDAEEMIRMCLIAAFRMFTVEHPLETRTLQEAIFRDINARRTPEEQLTWAEYEMLLSEEKLQAEAARQLEKDTKLKASYKLMLSAGTIETAIAAKLLELSQRRWHVPGRQYQGDPDVTRLAESMPVPPTFMNHTGPEAA